MGDGSQTHTGSNKKLAPTLREDALYQLAYQCGVWDIEWFERSIPPQILDRWMWWFQYRPQGQYHLYKMQALIASSLIAAQGGECEPDHFLWWERKPFESLSPEEQQREIDNSWANVSSLIPKSPKVITGKV